MAISGSATTNRTSALEPRHVGSPAYRRWGTDRSDIWRWGADLSAPQQIAVGSRQVGYLALGADLSAPQPIAVGEPTGRFPRILPFGSRHVGSLDIAGGVHAKLHISSANGNWWDILPGTSPGKWQCQWHSQWNTHQIAAKLGHSNFKCYV